MDTKAMLRRLNVNIRKFEKRKEWLLEAAHRNDRQGNLAREELRQRFKLRFLDAEEYEKLKAEEQHKDKLGSQSNTSEPELTTQEAETTPS